MAAKRKMIQGSADSTNGSGGSLALADFIAPAVVQFLGVRSLVQFGATCESYQDVVQEEVKRRKACIAVFEAEVKSLMGEQPGSIPLRANVLAARNLVETAKRLIDDEINFHEKLGRMELRFDDEFHWHDFDWRDFDFFLEERKKFFHEELGSLYILPDCFYFPPGGESSSPSQTDIARASQTASWIWGAEDHMGSVYEWCMDDPDWYRKDWEQPFRKFHLSGADFFTYECMEDAAYALARGSIDAFRIAARKVFFGAPASRDCLWYTLEKADEFASRCSDDEEEDEVASSDDEEDDEVATIS